MMMMSPLFLVLRLALAGERIGGEKRDSLRSPTTLAVELADEIRNSDSARPFSPRTTRPLRAYTDKSYHLSSCSSTMATLPIDSVYYQYKTMSLMDANSLSCFPPNLDKTGALARR